MLELHNYKNWKSLNRIIFLKAASNELSLFFIYPQAALVLNILAPAERDVRFVCL